MDYSRLGVHLPDADQLTGQEIGAVLDLKPAAMLVIVYAQWDNDKGVAQQTTDIVLSLRHDRLYVRFHADPHPPGYAKAHDGGARGWGRLCAQRMAQYYGSLAASGVQLHAILANETDADYEGGLTPKQSSRFYADALDAYHDARPDDILHVPAPTGAPQTHREHLQRYKADGWLRQDEQGRWCLSTGNQELVPVWIDGHGYDGDLENVINVLDEECPGSTKTITETNDLDDFRWPIELLRQGRARDIIYFTLNWARGGEGRIQPASADDAAKRMSLLRFPDRYAQFKATVGQGTSPSEPVGPPPPPPPLEPSSPTTPTFPLPVDDDGNEWKASTADVQQAIIDVFPRIIDPSRPRHAVKLGLALGLAESGSQPGREFQEQERWHIWTDHGKEAVRQRNLGYAAQVIGWGKGVGAIGTNDFSAGPFHKAMAWTKEFPGDPTDPDDPYRWDVMLWLEHRKRFIQDHGYATEYAARDLKPYYDKRSDDLQWVLERYNKPNEEVHPNVRANYARCLEIAESWLQAWGWQEEGTTPSEPIPPPVMETVTTRFESYTDPAPVGTFAQVPLGVIIHGSRSGRASNPIDAEYAGTARWELNNPDGLGWNATIGDGVVAIHMDARHWGWNASAASRRYIGIEFAQPTEANEITRGQVQALCDYLRQYVLPIWPTMPLYFPTHAEVEHSGETGTWYGKTDVFSFGSPRANELRSRIVASLTAKPAEPAEPSEPTRPETDQEKVARMVSAIGYMGGTLPDILENIRALVDDDMVRPHEGMTQAQALAALATWWRRWDDTYQELGNVGSELRRVRDEQLK